MGTNLSPDRAGYPENIGSPEPTDARKYTDVPEEMPVGSDRWEVKKKGLTSLSQEDVTLHHILFMAAPTPHHPRHLY